MTDRSGSAGPEPRIKRWHLGVLALLAILQVGWQAQRAFRTGPSLEYFTAGDGVGELYTFDASGRAYPLQTGELTMLLVFHSECPRCTAIAPEWKAFIDRVDDVSVIAVTSELHEIGRAYADSHGWNVEVRTMKADKWGSPEYRLTARTPYAALLSPDGVIIGEGHGSLLDSLHALVPAGVSAQSPNPWEPHENSENVLRSVVRIESSLGPWGVRPPGGGANVCGDNHSRVR